MQVGSAGDKNPLTHKSYLIRYWNKPTGNSHTKPMFLLSKASPLSAVESPTTTTPSPLASQPSVLSCPPPTATADQRSHTTGIFFRESMLKKGTVMPMPDIKDKLPERSFLPRSISSKLPFSMSKISELKRVFHAGDNSTMETMIVETLKTLSESSNFLAISQGLNYHSGGSSGAEQK